MNSNKRRFSGDEVNHSPPKKQRIALYLDDYTPIRTIEVTNFKDEVCSGYLRGYFECYQGPVSNVTIVNRKLENDQEIRVAHVTFVVPEDAAKLIFDPNLQFEFMIKEAESVYQPKIDPNVFKFEEITDDCLSSIASFLNLIDIVNLGRTSNRLRSFAQQIYRKRTHFSFGTNTGDSSVNTENLPIILREMGTYIRSIHWKGLTDRHMEYLTEYCQSVTTMKLGDPSCHLQLPSIEKHKTFFKNIESLEIENAGFSDATMNAIITSSSKLKSLQLVRCLNVKGKFLSEWKGSKLEHLKIAYCLSMSPASILDFQRNNKLIKFSSDIFDSFVSCLSLPAGCLSEYTELELVLNSSTDEKLDLLHVSELKQLKKIHLTCRNLDLFYQINYEPTFYYYENVFAAMSQIDTLKSITVEKAIIDANTIKSLASIKNLEEITFKKVKNRVASQLYSDLHVYLPKITKLTMKMENRTEEIDLKSICDMISSLVHLRYFSHSLMTWKLLDMILQVQRLREQSTIEIGISKIMFNNPSKKYFDAMSKGAVILSLNT